MEIFRMAELKQLASFLAVSIPQDITVAFVPRCVVRFGDNRLDTR